MAMFNNEFNSYVSFPEGTYHFFRPMYMREYHPKTSPYMVQLFIDFEKPYPTIYAQSVEGIYIYIERDIYRYIYIDIYI